MMAERIISWQRERDPSFYLALWGSAVRSSTLPVIIDAYHNLPSLGNYPPNGRMDLEYGPLLLAKNLCTDQLGYYTLLNSQNDHYSKGLIESLKRLEWEGILRLSNYSLPVQMNKDRIIQSVQAEISNRHEFLSHSITMWEPIARKCSEAMGRPNDPLATFPIAFLHALRADSKAFNESNAAKLRKVVFKKEKLSNLEIQLLGEMARPYLEHVHSHLALSEATGSTIFDWEDMSPVYNTVLRKPSCLRKDNDLELNIPKVRELFRAIPWLEPANVEEYIEARKDKHGIASFRRFINKAVKKGIIFDATLSKNLMIEMANSKRRSDQVESIVFPISIALSMLPGLGGITHGLVTAGHEAIKRKIQKSVCSEEDLEWVYCLINAKNKGYAKNKRRALGIFNPKYN